MSIDRSSYKEMNVEEWIDLLSKKNNATYKWRVRPGTGRELLFVLYKNDDDEPILILGMNNDKGSSDEFFIYVDKHKLKVRLYFFC